MDFQAPNPAPEKATGFPHNELLVSTRTGAVPLPLTDSIPSNLSADDLKTIAEQLLTERTSFSDTTTVDSDDPVSSDGSALILPPAVRALNEIKPKRRGGWPKGRKRKPELLHLPPKAPTTGYNLYLNEMRAHFKNSGLAFYEITKIVGNQWSNLGLEEKLPYLESAEEDKRRYREELREYRQSGSYQLYLAKKRKKRALNNILSESDMDATDDIDDEDNEELYCRTCDQWFRNLHNKREHLQSRLHFHAVVGDMRSELDPRTPETSTKPALEHQKSVSEIMVDLITAVSKRDKEIGNLSMVVQEGQAVKTALSQQLLSLKEREAQLRKELKLGEQLEKDFEEKIFNLWRVPSLFIKTELGDSDIEASEYSVTE